MADAMSELMSWSLLAQYCAVGVDPYTVKVGYIISSHFKLSVKGERNVSNALNNLSVYGDDNPEHNGLSFGFSIDHIIRNREVNTSGFELTSLCGVLLEYYDEEFAARVFHELARMLDDERLPANMRPPLRQWKTMVHACNGVFAATGFGVSVEDFNQMGSTKVSRIKRDASASPRSIARILQGIGQVSLGRAKAITVSGGGDAGWVAAVAQWLFDLRVVVLSQSGVELYTNSETPDPQFVAIFDLSSEAESSAKYPSQTRGFLYDLKDTSRFSAGAPALRSARFASGRVPGHFLAKVFSEDFLTLVSAEWRTVGLAIGSVARAFEGLAIGELGKTYPELASVQNMHNPGSYGAGLVELITTWMPGLRHFAGQMNRGIKMTFQEASDCYREQVALLRKICGPCGICSPEDNRANIRPGLRNRGYCKLVIVEMIVALGLALSRITVTTGLLPKRSGIEGFYARQVDKRIQTKDPSLSEMEHFVIIYSNELKPVNVTRLEVCVELFCGCRAEQDIRNGLRAIAHEGICAYLVGLENGTKQRGSAKEGLIRVTPGKIQHQRKVFDRVSDGEDLTSSQRGDVWEAIALQDQSAVLYCI